MYIISILIGFGHSVWVNNKIHTSYNHFGSKQYKELFSICVFVNSDKTARRSVGIQFLSETSFLTGLEERPSRGPQQPVEQDTMRNQEFNGCLWERLLGIRETVGTITLSLGDRLQVNRQKNGAFIVNGKTITVRFSSQKFFIYTLFRFFHSRSFHHQFKYATRIWNIQYRRSCRR